MGVNLAETLPPLLRERGWTQDRLADATGIKRTDINALAKGRIEAGPERLRRIAEALDVSVLELGAPEEMADEPGLSLLARQEELEAGLVALTKEVHRLARLVDAAGRPVQSKKRGGGSAR